MSSPNGSAYQVVLSGRALDKLKELHQRAKDKGYGPRVVSAVKRMVALLRTDLLQFGEPRFTLPYLKLEVRVGAMPPLLVVYGVHQERRVVFVRDFLPLPGANF